MSKKKAPARRVRKARIQPYIAWDTRKCLVEYCARRGVSESFVVDAALHQYLHGTSDMTMILERFGSVERAIGRVAREQRINAEFTSEWQRVWYRNTPPLPPTERAANRQEADHRYEMLRHSVARNIADGTTILKVLAQDVRQFELESPEQVEEISAL